MTYSIATYWEDGSVKWFHGFECLASARAKLKFVRKAIARGFRTTARGQMRDAGLYANGAVKTVPLE